MTGAGRPARPVRPALSREYIIRTALELIDRDGLAALSMRKLGAELRTDPMAVYHHLPNKAALFDGVVEAMYTEIEFTPHPDRSWRDELGMFMRAMRAVLRRHPNALPVISTRPAYSPTMMRVGEVAMQRLTAAGFSTAEALDVTNCLGVFTIGHALAEVGEPVGGAHATPEDMRARLSATEHPNLIKIFAEGYEYQPDRQYESGLTALLDGFELRLAVVSRPGDPARTSPR